MPQCMLDALVSRASFPNVELMHEDDTYKLGFAGGVTRRSIRRHPEPRQVWIAEQGIDVQINEVGSTVSAMNCHPMKASLGAVSTST